MTDSSIEWLFLNEVILSDNDLKLSNREIQSMQVLSSSAAISPKHRFIVFIIWLYLSANVFSFFDVFAMYTTIMYNVFQLRQKFFVIVVIN